MDYKNVYIGLFWCLQAVFACGSNYQTQSNEVLNNEDLQPLQQLINVIRANNTRPEYKAKFKAEKKKAREARAANKQKVKLAHIYLKKKAREALRADQLTFSQIHQQASEQRISSDVSTKSQRRNELQRQRRKNNRERENTYQQKYRANHPNKKREEYVRSCLRKLNAETNSNHNLSQNSENESISNSAIGRDSVRLYEVPLTARDNDFNNFDFDEDFDFEDLAGFEEEFDFV